VEEVKNKEQEHEKEKDSVISMDKSLDDVIVPSLAKEEGYKPLLPIESAQDHNDSFLTELQK